MDQDPNAEATQLCPLCAEEIKAAARICRYCRSRLDDGRPAEPYRRRSGRQVAGVAVAVADYLNVSVTLVRLGFLVGIVFNGIGLLAYLALWLMLPAEPGGVTPFGRLVAKLGGGRSARPGAASVFAQGVARVRARFEKLRARMHWKMLQQDDAWSSWQRRCRR